MKKKGCRDLPDPVIGPSDGGGSAAAEKGTGERLGS